MARIGEQVSLAEANLQSLIDDADRRAREEAETGRNDREVGRTRSARPGNRRERTS